MDWEDLNDSLHAVFGGYNDEPLYTEERKSNVKKLVSIINEWCKILSNVKNEEIAKKWVDKLIDIGVDGEDHVKSRELFGTEQEDDDLTDTEKLEELLNGNKIVEKDGGLEENENVADEKEEETSIANPQSVNEAPNILSKVLEIPKNGMESDTN